MNKKLLNWLLHYFFLNKKMEHLSFIMEQSKCRLLTEPCDKSEQQRQNSYSISDDVYWTSLSLLGGIEWVSRCFGLKWILKSVTSPLTGVIFFFLNRITSGCVTFFRSSCMWPRSRSTVTAKSSSYLKYQGALTRFLCSHEAFRCLRQRNAWRECGRCGEDGVNEDKGPNKGSQKFKIWLNSELAISDE